MFFKSQGFNFVFLPSNWYYTVKNDNADIILNPFFLPLDKQSPNYAFQKIMFFDRTFLGNVYYIIANKLFNLPAPLLSIEELQRRIHGRKDIYNIDEFFQIERFDITDESYRIHILNTFKNLTYAPSIPGKKFVFSHIDGWTLLEKSEVYPDEIRRVNQLIESTLREIITESETAPVIVLMSDHGRKPSPEAIEENRSIFAKYACYPNESLSQDYIEASWYDVNNIEAFYLPEGGNESIYPGMTPVNAWRMILNYYFGTEFPRAEDRSFFYWNYGYGMCEV